MIKRVWANATDTIARTPPRQNAAQQRPSRYLHGIVQGLLALMLAIPGFAADTYPLDGLSAAELETAVEVLRQSGRVDDTSRFSIIRLAEPDKATVLRWKEGDSSPRRAFAVIRHEERVFEATIDLNRGELEAWQHIEGVQPAMFPEEWLLANKIVRANEAWQHAVKSRGIDNLKAVICVPTMPGYFDSTDDANHRLGKIICYDSSGEQSSWGRPIEGLVSVVDFDRQEIVELIDTGVVPIPRGGPMVDREQPANIPAVSPAGQGFAVSGHWVEWDKWRFHLRMDPRVGPVLSSVSVRDADTRRSVLYEAYISEIFVPYMDPGSAWYFRTFLDIGEYGIGASAVPLQAGRDCPADAWMMDATFADERGAISNKPGMVCIFERNTGDVAWSHYEVAQRESLSKRYGELVVRFVAWLGNYDYVIDWIFTPTGSIKGRIGATGIVQTKAVNSRDMSSATSATDTAYGRLIAANAVAVNHDHFFNFRLDLDVDGSRNELVVDKYRRVVLDSKQTNTPRKSIWQLVSEKARSEAEAKRTIDLQNPAIWRVANSSVTNPLGHSVSYQLKPGRNAVSLLDRDGFPQRRAAFTNHHLWVTPYAAGERYAAGDYPNQHPGGAGLPEWTRQDRSVRNTDIVLWYTLGMHHAVRTEDWPIMPTVHNEFELRPFDFFGHNPTITDAVVGQESPVDSAR